MGNRLAGKVCIITGTGAGIGRAAALLFAREGASIVGCDINPASGASITEEVRKSGGKMVSLHPCNLTSTQQCAALFDLALNSFGRIDVLYNNAAKAYFNWIEAVSDEEWKKTLDEEVNLVFFLTRAAWPHLKNSSGVIINTASTAAWASMSSHGGIAHGTAKAGIVAMTRHLAMEGRTFGIRANSISPGPVETEQTREQLQNKDWAQQTLGRTMLGRAAKPQEIASVALFLSCAESSYITGTDVRADVAAWHGELTSGILNYGTCLDLIPLTGNL